jgi:hypothetical protein
MDLTVLGSAAALTLVTIYLYTIHVDVAYPFTMREANSYGLRGNDVRKASFGFATTFGWFGAAYYFAGRWAERNR